MSRSVFETLLARYGTEVTVTRASGTSAEKAFVQPLSYRSKQYPDEAFLPAGNFDNSHFFYLGSARRPVNEACTVRWQGREFSVLRAEVYFLGRSALYQWAVLAQSGGPDPEGTGQEDPEGNSPGNPQEDLPEHSGNLENLEGGGADGTGLGG